jgi:lipocalin-like protein
MKAARIALAAGIAAACISTIPLAQGNKGIAGTWAMVKNTTELDGKVVNTYGDKPMGQVTFTADGRYNLMIARPDMPKFASNNRNTGTPEENKAIVQGMISHYGRYTMEPDGKTMTFHIESASFPNWNGTSQKRVYQVGGDELQWTTPGASGGGTAKLVWKRVK